MNKVRGHSKGKEEYFGTCTLQTSKTPLTMDSKPAEMSTSTTPYYNVN